MKTELSIIMPGIRVALWEQVYESILCSTRRSFELIVCSPYFPSVYFADKKNFKFIRDFGNPVRASNIATELAESFLWTHISDDSVCLPGALDAMIDAYYDMGEYEKNVVLAQYYEGRNGTVKVKQPDSYYRLANAGCTYSPYLDPSWYVYNICLMRTSYFRSLGMWNCAFQACPMAHSYTAVKSQAEGANVKMLDVSLLDCDHDQSDHKPIEIAQLGHDEPLFQSIFRRPHWRDLMMSNFKTWRESPPVWKQRFTN